jgi:hypothetical protein
MTNQERCELAAVTSQAFADCVYPLQPLEKLQRSIFNLTEASNTLTLSCWGLELEPEQ